MTSAEKVLLNAILTTPDELLNRAAEYATTRHLEIKSSLGAGTQGTVYLLHDPSRLGLVAVKFHEREIAYLRERDVYLRLRALNIDEVQGHEFPQLIDFDDELLAIEMTIVWL